MANTPMAWVNLHVNPYLVRMKIIPESQVANHKGIQPRDITSALSSIASWAIRNKKTVFMIKRDQMKGFDFLSKTGFHDAVRAYGMPEGIIALDEASQTNVKCQARTAHGLTEPFTINRLTKQGGSLSPCKCVMTTSMLNWWLQDLSRDMEGTLAMKSANGEMGNVHSPSDSLVQPMVITEAMDNSILASTDLKTTNELVYASEHFLLAYQWITNWDPNKSSASVFGNVDNVPNEIELPSVSPYDTINPLKVTLHKLNVHKNKMEYLRTSINDPSRRAQEIRDIIAAFQFPRFITKVPLTLARKLVQQTLIAQVRAKLNLHNNTAKDAEELDTMLTNKLHTLQGMPYKPSPVLLTLPLEENGFGFPSISRINFSIAMQGVERDLNHPIGLYRRIARITIADWTCQLNDCIDPLEDCQSHEIIHVKKRLPWNKIPAQYVLAKMVCQSVKMSLKRTDLSYFSRGEVSIRHLMSVARYKGLTTLSNTNITTLDNHRMTQVEDLGRWDVSGEGRAVFHPIATCAKRKETKASMRAKLECITIMEKWDLLKLSNCTDLSILTSRWTRQRSAENFISNMLQLKNIDTNNDELEHAQWGTDGSQSPASARVLDVRSVYCASVGNRRLRMRLTGNGKGILQGEVMGLVIANIDALSATEKEGSITIYSDHKYSVHTVESYQVHTDALKKMNFSNARSYFRWLCKLISRHQVVVKHVKAHTGGTSIPQILNERADELASRTDKEWNETSVAPEPTFFMNDFTAYHTKLGWYEGGVQTLTETLLNVKAKEELKMSSYRLASRDHSQLQNPEHMYKSATSSHSAVVQLYAR